MLSATCKRPLFSLSGQNQAGATIGGDVSAIKAEQMHTVAVLFKPVQSMGSAANVLTLLHLLFFLLCKKQQKSER